MSNLQKYFGALTPARDRRLQGGKSAAEKPTVTLRGRVEKIIPSGGPSEPERAQIVVESADELYREIRIENTLQDAAGNVVGLKEGAEVNVTIEAEADATTPKSR